MAQRTTVFKRIIIVVLITFLAGGSSVMGQSADPSSGSDNESPTTQLSAEERQRLQQQHVAEAAKLFEDQDHFAAIAHVATIENEGMACNVLGDLLFMMYYEKKNLTAALRFGQAAVKHAIAAANAADAAGDDDRAKMFRGYARSMCYNIASFTWPGWNEEGITIGEVHREIGRDAVKANFRMAVNMGGDANKLSNAFWLMGAHQLADANYGEAKVAFAKAAEQAAISGKRNMQLMNQCYALLSVILAGNAAAEADLEAAFEELKPLEEGPFFVDQIRTVRKVFEGSR